MTIRKAMLWIPLAVLVMFVGFAVWAFLYYRPTLEYAYTDASPVQLLFIAIAGLIVLALIAWLVFKK